MNLGVVEDRGRIAEDEVHSALNIGVDIILPPVIREQRVLVAEETAVLEDRAIAAHRGRHRLPGIAGRVLKGDVVRLEALPLISTVSVKNVPPACFAFRLLVITTSAGDFPMPTSVMLVWFCVTITRS